MATDYSRPVLDGVGDTDYARYMRTDALLALQRTPEEMIHRDELLFQTVHQSTELWLKLACFEVAEATDLIDDGALDDAVALLARAALGVELVTQQLAMLRHLAPSDFQLVRTVLGHGSGFESPGWRSVQHVSAELGRRFDRLVRDERIDLVTLYRGPHGDPVYRLAEAMIEWDEHIAVWRVSHYKVAVRTIGPHVVGTKGTPVDTLARLINHQMFPDLWRVRTTLTELGPLGNPVPARAS